MREKMNLLVAINHTYIKQLNILLNSVQISNPEEIFFVYLLHQNLEKAEIEQIKIGLDLQRINLIPIQIEKSEINLFPVVEKRYPVEIYFRIFATKYLPKDIDRVLYLDADTLVINQLNELYYMDFEKNYYVAATHIGKLLHKFHEIRLDIEKDEPYINTGVLLINLEELRKIDMEKQVIEYIKKNKNKLMLPDQDIITAMYGDKIKLMDHLKYNLGDREFNLYNFEHPKEKLDLKWVCKNTVILHYYGRNKPWQNNYVGTLGTFYEKIESQIKKETKVLILSCGTGGGHNTAAKALRQELLSRGVQADFKEYLEIISTKLKDGVNHLYLRSTKKEGKTFKTVYKLGELYERTKIKSPVYLANQLSRNKLYAYIQENQYNLVMTTHLFAAQALTAIKKQHKIKFIAVATDYVSIPFWKETNPNYLMIPHSELKQDFIEKGNKPNKLVSLGIPVRTQFSQEYDQNACRKQLNLKENEKYVLILTGSMGFGKIKEVVKELENKIHSANFIIACGTNVRLKAELEQIVTKRTMILPYQENIDLYMKSSDIILTKPGGLTSTEVATLRKPLIHTMPIPGCETYNADFFSKRKMSIKCETVEDICQSVKNLLEHPSIGQELMENQAKNIDKNATKKIIDFSLETVLKGNLINS